MSQITLKRLVFKRFVVGCYQMRIPAHADHRFRRMPITSSGASRSLIPAQADH